MERLIYIFFILPSILFGGITFTGGLSENQVNTYFNGNISPPASNLDADTEISFDFVDGNIEAEGDLSDALDAFNEATGHVWEAEPFTDIDDPSLTGYGMSNAGDMDNDVPTLRQILYAVEGGDRDNDNYLLEQILDELKKGNEKIDSESSTTEFDQDKLQFSENPVFPTDLNPFADVTTGSGSMPDLTITVPDIQGGTAQKTIDLDSPKFAILWLVAQAGITSVVVVQSVRGTAWTAGQILGS